MNTEQWLHVAYDSLPAAGKMTFFDAGTAGVSSENLRLIEADATDFLIQHFKRQLCQLLGRPLENTFHEIGVVQPFTTRDKTPGNIDLLFYDRVNPAQTAACEIKVMQKNVENSNNNFITGLHRLHKGVEQCEGLIGFGFHEVYLVVIVLANVSPRQDRNLPNRTLALSDWENIRSRFNGRVGQSRIGFINIEICQTGQRPLAECGNISGVRFKTAPQKQQPRITELCAQRIRELNTPPCR
jgi:hypothetical protein